MVKITPFKAFRPSNEMAATVASPPYDVLDTKEALVLAGDNEASFLHVNKPEIDLPLGTNLYSDEVYAKGVENLEMFKQKGFLIEDDKPYLYIYAQRMGDHTQYGIVGGASVEEYVTGKIKKHENTRQAKEDDRTRLTWEQRANVGPVFLMYDAKPEIDAVVAKYTATKAEQQFIAHDDVEHYIWVVRDDADIELLKGAFETVPATYVADGHHRSASAARVGVMMKDKLAKEGKEDIPGSAHHSFLAVYFPAEQLKIMEYNRAVKDLNDMSPEDFMAKVAERFNVTEVARENPVPEARHHWSMLLGGKWFDLTLKADIDESNPVECLDCFLLSHHLLDPILEIGDLRTTERVKFVGGIRGYGELEKLCNEGFKVAFNLFPVSPKEIIDIADADKLMPPKATWFEPKLASGMVTKCF
eukprot:TRINITY_DN777864_c0_g1_i1.p1 TRINITY_DN777864_c0_g1~~TRINITY_DN777864_c0_g1_i1.p1  ORF type:complete len:416 (+),score=145.44 TRINITY_DN777864_c0_g1_i1:75-1322(+)